MLGKSLRPPLGRAGSSSEPSKKWPSHPSSAVALLRVRSLVSASNCSRRMVSCWATTVSRPHRIARTRWLPHKRWRPTSRTPLVWQPFPRTKWSTLSRARLLEDTWAWMKTRTLWRKTCRRLQRAVCHILDSQTLRRIRQRLRESGRTYDIARMDDLEAGAEDHSWPTSINLARALAPVEWVTRVRIRQGCEISP